MKILIAEDDAFMAAAIEQKLKSDGHQVILTRDGREALQLVEMQQPDLIITDILMPFISGLELIGIIKSSLHRKIPIIVLSGMDQEATVLEAFELGADDFLTKPFNAVELSMRVKRTLKLITKKRAD
ncbi:MAG TPA: response regulator transcription factor [Chitinophagaceae bacterium]|jgi:DNA-binding response OmpR family regulator|nr:response regulator transcription factor [Chitinophagaceae bacterium]MBP9740506.1 response regulator transcription factor [Chitinophagaceae bacterium]HPH22532.1 response regulator transcription factor [Chitinophagaceae bacterium]